MQYLIILQIIFSVFLCILVLLQPRQAGLSSGIVGVGAVEFKRRGAAKTLHGMTVFIGTLFIINAIILFVIG